MVTSVREDNINLVWMIQFWMFYGCTGSKCFRLTTCTWFWLRLFKRLLCMWSKRDRPRKFLLLVQTMLCVNEHTIKVGYCLSYVLPRKCRTMKNVDHWKAFRIKTISSSRQACCIKGRITRRIVSEFFCTLQLLRTFFPVWTCDVIYWTIPSKSVSSWWTSSLDCMVNGEMVFNVHAWLHICNIIRVLGSADRFSVSLF